MFNNELELLKFRINSLAMYVDLFIVCESKKTFTNNTKKLIFTEFFKSESNQFSSELKNKITILTIDDFESLSTPWQNEEFQRNYPGNYLIDKNIIGCEDLVLSMDVDEIPSPKTLNYLKENSSNLENLSSISMWLAYFYPNYIKVAGDESEWTGPYALKAIGLHKNCLHQYRLSVKKKDAKLNNQFLRYGGWHWSYQGDEEFYKTKLESFSHQEKTIQKNKIIDIAEIIKRRVSPFDGGGKPQWAFLSEEQLQIPSDWMDSLFLKNFIRDYDNFRKIIIILKDENKKNNKLIKLFKIIIKKIINLLLKICFTMITIGKNVSFSSKRN